PALLEGRGDLAAGVLTVTPERQAQVDFGAPFFRDVAEIAVTGPQSPTLASVDDLAGQEVFTRRSSSYWTHLEALSERFEQAGREAIRLREAPEELQDDDLLEMLNSGLVGIVVVDRYKAKLWAQVLPNIRPQEQVIVNSGGEIAWMMRKGSPQLQAAVDAFAETHGKGSAFGNTIIKKYTGSTRFVKDATSKAELEKFNRMVELFRKYGAEYDLDAILIAAQGYQESRLDQDAKSRVGAIGVMQIMPKTGEELAVGDIRALEPNIRGGNKYIRKLID
ncbi:MAG: lytic transglycosylase F, partial [Acidobacteria bacterium]|nr:lytic transglycosylase F [Acidobacteriota bacterium]